MNNDLHPVPQNIVSGTDVLVRLTKPEVPEEFDSQNQIWTLSFVNLDDQLDFPFVGTERDNEITFLFNSSGMTPGAYQWLLNLQVDNEPVYHDDDVFNGTFTQPPGTPYTWEPLGSVVIPETVQTWVFTLPGREETTLITTDRIRGLNPSVQGQFNDRSGGWGRGFLQIGLDGNNRRHGIGRTADYHALYYTSFPGSYDIRIQNHVAAQSILHRVSLRGYSTVVEPTERKIHERTMITLLEKILEDRLADRGDVVSYSLGGRSLAREPIDALYQLLAKYKDAFARRKRGGRQKKVFGYSDVAGIPNYGTTGGSGGAQSEPAQNGQTGDGLTANEVTVLIRAEIPVNRRVPSYTSADKDKILAVNSAGDNLLFIDPPSGGGGLSQSQVDQRIAPEARAGNNDRWSTAKVPTLSQLGGQTLAQVNARIAAQAQTGNTDRWPTSKVPTLTQLGGLSQTQVDARVRAGVADWAETSNNSVIPNAKLPDSAKRPAPTLSGLGGLTQGQVDARIATEARAGNNDRWSTSKVPTLATLGGVTSAEATAAAHAVLAAGIPSNRRVPAYQATDRDKFLAINPTGSGLVFVDAPSGGGTGTGLTQTQVDARVRAGVLDWAEFGNNSVIPDAKLPDSAKRPAPSLTTIELNAQSNHAEPATAQTYTEWTDIGNLTHTVTVDGLYHFEGSLDVRNSIAPDGGGDRIFSETRIVHVRGSTTTEIVLNDQYIRNVTNVAESREFHYEIAAPIECLANDVVKLQFRFQVQVVHSTRQMQFLVNNPSTNKLWVIGI